MQITQDEFNQAIKIANEAGKNGKEVDITYVPATSATQLQGQFVTVYYTRTASGKFEPCM